MHSAAASRWLAMMVTSAILFGAGATSPAFVLGDEPSPPPAEQPEVTPPPADEPAAPSPLPVAPPTAADEPPGVERIDLRTADTRTYEKFDGSFVTELYTDAIYYQPEGRTDWQPIDTRLEAVAGSDEKARVDKAPARLSLNLGDDAGGFVSITGAGRTISFGLPAGTAAGRAASAPVVMEDGLFADYADFLPGGIGLRVFPSADGVKTFLVLPSKPATSTFSLAIDAPGLTFVAQDDGSIEIRDEKGAIVGRLPRPFLMDSSDVEGRGGGLYAEAVT